jgi:nucleoid DNA-binding protein
MNKSDVIKRIAERASLSQSAAGEALEGAIGAITEALEAGIR